MAAGRDMRARLVLLLQDGGISGRLFAIQNRLAGIGSAARRISAIGLGLAALNFAGPVQSAAAYDDILLQTQITAGGVGPAAVAAAREAGRAWERLALETGTRSRDIAGAAQNLVAAGLSRADVDRFMPILARSATATGASLEDLSRVAVALRQNLSISSAEELTGALAAMTQAGKAGMFELRDMAREFPQLTAAAQALGLTGRNAVDSLASMLQVARQGASSSSEAANNLANFLQKLNSPETVRNFQQLGVNLEGVLQDAARRGINPIEAVIQKIRERTGGNMFRVGSLFGDRQVLDFLRPILRGTQDYLDILQAARRANGELINQDFGTRMQGAALQLAIVQERGEQILRRIGLAAAANLGPLSQFLALIQDGIGWLDQHYPGVLDQTIAWTASVAALAGALGLLAPVFGIITAGLGLLLSPIGLAAGAIAGLAVLIYRNWSTIGPWLNRQWESISGFFLRLGELAQREWSRITGSEQLAELRRLLTGLGTAIGNLLSTAWESTPLQSFLTGLRFVLDGIAEGARVVIELLGRIPALRSAGTAPEASSNPAMNAPAQAERARRNGARRIEGYDAEEDGDAPVARGRAAPVTGGRSQAPATQLLGNLRIDLAPGLVLRSAETNQPGVAVTGSQGPVLGRL